MTPDAVVTEWLPVARRRALDAASCAPAALAALNYVGRSPPVTVLSLTFQAFGRLASVVSLVRWRSARPASSSSGCFAYPVTIDDHAAARDWIAGTIAAISPGKAHNEVFALRAYQPAALLRNDAAHNGTPGSSTDADGPTGWRPELGLCGAQSSGCQDSDRGGS
jgi:hypothetical protein